MKKIKIAIIFLVILIVVLFSILFYIFINSQSDSGNPKSENILNTTTDNGEIKIVEKEIVQTEKERILLKQMNEMSEYLSVKRSLEKYISEINTNNSKYFIYNSVGDYVKTATVKEISANIYNLFSEEYIRKNNINASNAYKFVYEIDNQSLFTPVKVKKICTGEFVTTYAVYGVIQNLDYELITEEYLILNISEINSAFSIEKLNTKEELENYVAKEIENIFENENNTYKISKNNHESIIKDYNSDLKRLMLGCPEVFYNNILDSEYRDKRFGNINNFKDYVKELEDDIKQINIEQYRFIEDDNDCITYIVADQHEKLYIYKQNRDIWDYSVFLDDYTVILDLEKERYKEYDKIDKSGNYLRTFINMINTKDYEKAYLCLDETFKQSNFKTIEEFKKYLEDNIYDINLFEMEDSDAKIYEYYVFECKIINAKDKNQSKKVTFVVKPGEEDFDISFSINKE